MELTREQIEAMEAGAELDLAVAEHVMGYRWVNQEYFGASHVTRPHVMRSFLSPEDVKRYEDGGDWRETSRTDVKPGAGGGSTVSKFSTDIAAAWRVAEKLTAQNLMPCIFWHNPKDEGWRWHCGVGGIMPGDRDVEVDAATAPLVICRAALLVVCEQAREAGKTGANQ